MLIRNAQLTALGTSANKRFLEQLVAHQDRSFPQLPLAGTAASSVQTVASLAVAQHHGFFKQQDLAICTSCMAPFVAGTANPSAITAEAAKPLQTLIADTQGVLSKLPAASPSTALGPELLPKLQGYCASLVAASGSAPINMDRSGPVVPFSEQSPVKPADLAAAAATALPKKGSQSPGTVSADQMNTAVDSAKETFANVPPGEVVKPCKQLVDLEFRRVYWDGAPMANIPYTVTLSDGSTRKGTTDGSGLGSHTSVPDGTAQVVYGENKNPAKSSIQTAVDDDFKEFWDFEFSGEGS